jgi:hypothetical protein
MSIPRHIYALHALALASFGGLALAAASQPEPTPASVTQGEPQPRLIGFGCEPGAATLLANEEDEFPGKCREIEPVELACSASATGGPTALKADECAAFWGDGY